MSVQHGEVTASKGPIVAPPQRPDTRLPSESPTRQRPRARTGATWIGAGTAALGFVALIVFLLQNTGGVEVTFLWMHGSLPLAVALLITAVGVAVLAMVIAVARTTTLRRRFRRLSTSRPA